MKIAAFCVGALALACLCLPDSSMATCLKHASLDTCHYTMIR
jgi:hypothetical protein